MPAPLLLALAIVSEVVATLALRESDGFTRLVPSITVVLGYGLSFVLLAAVLKHIPVSLTYAVWSAAGTALVAIAGVLAYGESLDLVKAGSLALVVAGVVGLSAGGAH